VLLVSTEMESLLQNPPESTRILPMAYLGTGLEKESALMPLLTKPLRASQLVELLLQCLTGDLDSEMSSKRVPVKDSHSETEVWNARVLVVDDNESNLLVARLLLERLGCSVNTASSGNDALERTQHETFDMVFMDCSMPEVDGYEATRRLRSQEMPNTRNIVIAMTAYALSGDRQRCLDAGMDDYLSKPIDLASIREVLFRNIGPPTTKMEH
jgi:CheY-like chemotaxis protein